MIETAQRAKLAQYSEYLARGTHLVPIPPSLNTGQPTKVPVTSGWSLDQNIIRAADAIQPAWPGENWDR